MPEETDTNTADPSRLALKILTAVIIGFSGFLVLWLGTYAVFQVLQAGRILPEVKVGSLALGGLTPEEAGVSLYTQFNLSENKKTVLILPGGSKDVDLFELGIRLDAAATAMDAFQHGRGLLDGQWIPQMLHLYPDGYQVNPVIIFDQQSAYDYLLQLSQQVDQPVVEASLHLEGTRVVASPGQSGFSLDIPASIDRISQQILDGNLNHISLVVNTLEPDLMDASPFIATAEKFLSESFLLRIPDGQPDSGRTWEIDPDEIAPMLTFLKVTENGSTSITPRLRENVLISLLSEISAASAIGAENPHSF